MGGLILPFGFPVTNAGGTEGLGVGVDTATGRIVAPNGTTYASQAALDAAVLEALTNGQSVFGLVRNPK